MPVLLSLGLTVSSVNCDEWERTDHAVWRAESVATVIDIQGDVYTFEGGVDVDQRFERSLRFALEYFCRSDLDGGLPRSRSQS